MKLSHLAISAILEMYYYKDERASLEKLDLEPNTDGELDISEEVKRRLENHEDLVN